MMEYKRLKFLDVDRYFVIAWEGSLPLIETYFVLKVVGDFEDGYFSTIDDLRLPLSKNFLQRCSFAKYLEYMYHLTNPSLDVNSLHFRAASNISSEEVVSEVEKRVELYFSKTSVRSFR